MITTQSLGQDEAFKAIEAGISAAKRFGRPMAFAVVDPSGELIASFRMDGAPARIMRHTIRKAYTAAHMARNTLTLKRDLDDRHNTLWDWGDKQFTTLQGGMVVKKNAGTGGSPQPGDEVVGAVSAGGGTLETDEEVARIMVRAMGFEPVLDARLLPNWKTRAFAGANERRAIARLPLSFDWLARGQEPLTAVRMRDVIFTSGIPGIDMKTGALPDDPARQFELAFQNLQTLLEASGISSEEVGLINYYIPDASYRPYINRAWCRYYPGPMRPARKTNQVALPEGMVVQLQAFAFAGGKQKSIEIPGLWHKDPLPMGAQVGPLAFSSVIGGQEPTTGEMVADPEGQIRTAFDNIRLFMEQAGGTLDNVNHVWVFLQEDFKFHDAMVDTWVKTFPNEHSRPARKTLPYKLGGDMQIQVQLTAMMEGARRNFEIENVHHNDPIPMGSRTGRLVHSSGIAGLDPVKGAGVRSHFGSTAVFMVEGGLIAETDMALTHLGTFMKNAGGTLDDIAQLTVLVRKFSDAPIIMDRMKRIFPNPDDMPALRFINYRLSPQMAVQFHVTAVVA